MFHYFYSHHDRGAQDLLDPPCVPSARIKHGVVFLRLFQPSSS